MRTAELREKAKPRPSVMIGSPSGTGGIRRLPGSYFFHISCAQSGSQAGGDMRKASSAVDL